MGRCQKIRIPRRTLCYGDMRHRIDIMVRSLSSVGFGVTAHDLTLTAAASDIKAGIKTLKPGTTFFDGANDRAVGHEFYIHYVDYPGMTAEQWVLFDSRLFDVVAVERLDEDKRFSRLVCNERGNQSFAVNKQ